MFVAVCARLVAALSVISIVVAANAPDPVIAKRISTSCVECHDADVHKGNLRLDTLKPVEQDPSTLVLWTRIHDRVANGEMPPKKHLTAEEVATFTTPLAKSVLAADQQRQRTDGRVLFRRLNRVEYEHTLRDLLAIPDLEVKDILPPDGQAFGFDNVAAAQDVSYVQVARYLEAADSALDAAMVLRPKPETKTDRQVFQENGRFFEDFKRDRAVGRSESRVVGEWMVFLRQPNTAQTPWTLHNRFDEPGYYHFRIRCKAVHLVSAGTGTTSDDKLQPPKINHVAAVQVKDGRFLHFFDMPAEAGVVEFTSWLHGREQLVMFCATLDDRNQPGGSSPPEKKPYEGPGFAFDWMDMEGPLLPQDGDHPQWPPESHHRLFGDLPLVKWTKESGLQEPEPITIGTGLDRRSWRAQGGPFMVESKDPTADSERLLRNFMERAYRRPVDVGEVQRMQGLVLAAVAQKKCFQDAMRVGYKAVLCSPDFLFFRELPGKLDAYALATRLSYFLWRSMPDDALLAQAKSGALSKSEVLTQQTERMLKDVRAQRLVNDFTNQWLSQDQIYATVPDRPLYPEYFCDHHLVESLVGETRAYFNEMLSANLPAKNVITADFAMVNEQTARLYGIPGVQGCAIRKVPLPKDSPRGGFLTQGSILKVTANGLTTSPVKRGAWVLDHLLGTPAPPPPPDAGAIEPDTRGATTVREQLQKHRANPACAGCHAKIDPPGFALEAFDVMGGQRERYRSNGKGDTMKIISGVRQVNIKLGPAIDCTGELTGKAFTDIAGLRALLLADERQIARNLAS
ncbi:MAG TPA: DUF1592 domain-containing protein, partial [Planctomycetota bacterium]|nr:DUF1592 domain-containing protein [Planctomycetota bacterium]